MSQQNQNDTLHECKRSFSCTTGETLEKLSETTAQERLDDMMLDTTTTTTTTSSPSFKEQACSLLRKDSNKECQRFSITKSTEENYRSPDNFYFGLFSHIRKTLDYKYHCNYRKERQWFQDTLIEEVMDAVPENVQDDDDNSVIIRDMCSTPTWIIFTAGPMGSGKNFTIRRLIKKGHLPIVGYVLVDSADIRHRLPEFSMYSTKNRGKLTKKEAGYIAEIVTLAALQSGKNIFVDSSLSDVGWYQLYFDRLRNEYQNVKIALLQVTAPRDLVVSRAKDRCKELGRLLHVESIDIAFEQVPKSVEVLSPKVDYFCKIQNIDEPTIVTEGETWESFRKQFMPTSVWVSPLQQQNGLAGSFAEDNLDVPNRRRSSVMSVPEEPYLDSIKHIPIPRRPVRHFSLAISTEQNHKSHDKNFYGMYSHIRKTLDYTYHSNYRRERQWLQDTIITHFLRKAQVTDINGNVCRTPTEPWMVFTAGAMGSGKSYTLRALVQKGRFPLMAFVSVDPDEIRRHFPEYCLYVDQAPAMAGELTRKEAGYVAEILTLASLQSGLNTLVDGSLRDAGWYKSYFTRLKREHPNLRIAILHITAPRDAVFERAERRGRETGRVVPKAVLEMALEQVPKSVKILAPLADYFCELHNPPDSDDIILKKEGETWESFERLWLQTCAWIPKKKQKIVQPQLIN